MGNLIKDARYSLRLLIARPGFTIIAVLALALGIGANTSIFSVINGVLLKPLEYKDPDRLIRLWEKWGPFNRAAISYPNFKDWRDRNNSFEKLAVFRATGMNLTGSDAAERVTGQQISADFFSLLGVAPALGRDFTEQDDQPGATLTVIISDQLWATHFGRDSSIVGKPLSLGGESYQVIGVLPPTFHFFENAEIFVPIAAKKAGFLDHRSWHAGNQAIGRLKPEVSLAQARLDMEAVTAHIAEQYPDTNKGRGASLVSQYEASVGRVRTLLLLLLAAVAFVLLIACANVANLMLVRATARQKEVGIRLALGASRLRIARLLITESVMTGLLGGGLGLLAASWGTELAIKALPGILPRTGEIKIDTQVLLFTLAASVLTGVLFGLAPALQASNPDLNDILKEGGRTGTGGRQRLRSGLIVAEVALALVLLIGAGLVIRSVAILQKVSPGFDPKNVVAMDVTLSPTAYSDQAKAANLFRDLLDRIGSLPGVQAAATTDLLPLGGGDSELFFYATERPKPPDSELPLAMSYNTSPGYFEAMRIPLQRGRYFDWHDDSKTERVMVVDENLAREFFPGEDPIGKHITIHPSSDVSVVAQICGVVGHVKQENLDTAGGSGISPQFYLSAMQVPDVFTGNFATVLVRANGDPESLIPAIRAQLAAIDRDQPIFNARTLEHALSDRISNRRFALILLAIFAVLALALASIGIYGVMSYSVSQRTREIGIRMALGAARPQVLRLVVRDAARLALVGVLIGVTVAVLLTRFMSAFLFGISPTDPLTFLVFSMFLTGVALLASYIPARRAMRVDPVTALRYE
jgi:putative ABC transport system permease protein